jgi:Zn-dependent M28 family amino/carboxypeptidase
VTEIQAGLATSTELADAKTAGTRFLTMIELDSSVYRFTTNALEQGPSGSGLDAAGVRAAVGLAAANLDTQLGDLPTNAELTTALAAADDAVLSALVIIASAVSAVPTATQNADALLNRDMSAVSDTNARSPLNALRLLRNKWDVSGSTLTVKKEDDATTAWTATVSTSSSVDSIIGQDPG